MLRFSEGRRICHCDIVFVLDGSGSISDSEGDQVVDFVKGVVEILGDANGNDMQFGSVVFARRSAVRISLSAGMDATTFKNSVTLDRSGLGGNTKTHKGIEDASADLQQ